MILDNIDLEPCFLCGDMFIAKTHSHDIADNVIQNLQNIQVTVKLQLKPEFAKNFKRNLHTLYGVSKIEDMLSFLCPRMEPAVAMRREINNKLSWSRFGYNFVSFQVKGAWWVDDNNVIYNDHEACNPYGLILRPVQDVDTSFKIIVENRVPLDINIYPVLPLF